MEAYAGTMYDAVLLYALAVNETLLSGKSIRNGLEVSKRTYNRVYEGMDETTVKDPPSRSPPPPSPLPPWDYLFPVLKKGGKENRGVEIVQIISLNKS